MNITKSRAVTALLVLLFLATVVIISTHRSSKTTSSMHSPPSTLSTAQQPGATSTSITSTTQGLVSTTTTTTIVPAPVTKPSLRSLKIQLEKLVAAYYLITPEDTATSREARVAQYMPSSVLQLQTFNTKEGRVTNAYRHAHRLTLHGRVVVTQLYLKALGGEHEDVVAPVQESYQYPDGRVVMLGRVTTASIWHFSSGKWVLLSFTQGGNS